MTLLKKNTVIRFLVSFRNHEAADKKKPDARRKTRVRQ